MKIVGIRSRVNVSKYFPAFERLGLDIFASDPQNARTIRRSGTAAYRLSSTNKVQRIHGTKAKDPRYPEPRIDELDSVAQVFGEYLELKNGVADFWIEAQRVQCHFYDTGVMDLRGASAVMCVNRYNMEGGFIGAARVMPGCLYFSESESESLVMTSLRVSDLAYDVTGYLDCFVLHT